MQKQPRHPVPPSLRFSTSNGPEGGGGGTHGAVKAFGAPPQQQQQPQSGQPPQLSQEKQQLSAVHSQYQTHHLSYPNTHARQGVTQNIPQFFPANVPLHARPRQQYAHRIMPLQPIYQPAADQQQQIPFAAFQSMMNPAPVMYNVTAGGESRAGGTQQSYWTAAPPSMVMGPQIHQSMSIAASQQQQHNHFPYFHPQSRLPPFAPMNATPTAIPPQTQQLQQQPSVMVNNGQAGSGASLGAMMNVMPQNQREMPQPQGSKERKNRIQIIDPKTGCEVVLEEQAAFGSKSQEEHHPAPSTGTGQTAAEFAQKVAAAASEDSGSQREVGTEDCDLRSSTPVVSAQATSVVYELRKPRTPSPLQAKHKMRTPSPPRDPPLEPREQISQPMSLPTPQPQAPREPVAPTLVQPTQLPQPEPPREPLVREPIVREPPTEPPREQIEPLREQRQPPSEIPRESPPTVVREQPPSPREPPTRSFPNWEPPVTEPPTRDPPPREPSREPSLPPKELREVTREPPKDPTRESRESSREPKEQEKEPTPEPAVKEAVKEPSPPVQIQPESQATPPAPVQVEEKSAPLVTPVEEAPPEPAPPAASTPVAPPPAVSAPPAATASAPKKSSSFAAMLDFSSVKLSLSAKPPVEDPPAPVLQPNQQTGKAQQKAKNRKVKQRDINMKDKEGSDMDAFTDGPAKREASPAPAATPAAPAATASPDEEEEEISEASDALVAAKNKENARPTSPPATDVIETRVISRTEPSKPVLKYEYKVDQWSPVNPDGKKVYDRDFLLKLRQDPQSIKKPDNVIHDLEIFRDRESGRDRQNDRGGDSGSMRRNVYAGGFSSMQRNNNGFAPDFFKSSSLSQGSRMSSSGNKRMVQSRGSSSRDGGRGSKNYNSLSLRDDFRLNKAENAWKPLKFFKDRHKESKDEAETNELYRTVRGILNKLTPQKFETLVNQFTALPINTFERLNGVINLVFDKAIDEPAFSSSYAELCRFLGKIEVPKSQEEGQAGAQTFRKTLIGQCQIAFETNKKAELDFEKRQKDIDECPDAEKRRELQLLFNEEERKLRMKAVGLVRFIGELFKLNMLTANIMHGCIQTLLGKFDEESLECLCKLLTTIGKELEQNVRKSSSEQEWNAYFQRMELLSKKNSSVKVSSRVRFMLQDVIELRENKWVPRRDENKPKTMAEIQEEVDKESEKISQMAGQSLRRDEFRRPRGPRGSGGGGGGSNNQSDDGWNVVGKSMYRANYAPEAAKIQLIRTTAGLDMQNRNEVHLGSAKNFSRWVSGASAKGSGSGSQSSLNEAKFTSNAFGLLNPDDDHKPPMLAPRSSSKPSQNAERERAIQGVKNMFEESKNQTKRAEKREMPSPTPSPTAPVESETPADDAMIRKLNSQVHGLIMECHLFSKAEELEDTLFTLKELITRTGREKDICLALIEQNMSQKTKEGRILCYILLGKAIESQLLKNDVFVEAVDELVQIAEDLVLDLPNFWSYLGEIFSPLIAREIIDFSHFKTAVKDAGVNVHLESTIKEMLRYLIVELGPKSIKEIWDKSGVKLTDFLPEANAESVLKEFAFLQGAKVAVGDSNLSFERVEEKLISFLKEVKDGKYDEIFDWLTANVGPRTSDLKFIEVLTKAVIMASIITDTSNEEPKIDKSKLINHMILIKRYVDNKEELELRCLYMIQNLVVKTLESPSGMLLEIFLQLNDSSAVSPEGFMKWYKPEGEESPWECDGKGVAVKTLKTFFEALKQDLDEDEAS